MPEKEVAVASQSAGCAFSPTGKKKPSASAVVLPLKSIIFDKDVNPRGRDLGELDALTADMKKTGLLHPITVRPAAGGKYQLISGARRFTAAKSLGWDEIFAVVRGDLESDADALSLALSENSEDSRNDINPVPLGRAFKKLEDAGWPIPSIATSCGYNHMKVRRCLELVKLDASVQKKVESGSVSMMTALEFGKLDPTVQKKVDSLLSLDTSAATMKAAGKAAAKEAIEEAHEELPEPGKKHTKKGSRSRAAALRVRRSSTEQNAALADAATAFIGADDKEKNTSDWFQMRGILSALLWVRGDLAGIAPPATDPTDPEYSANRLKEFDGLIKAEAEALAEKNDGGAGDDPEDGTDAGGGSED